MKSLKRLVPVLFIAPLAGALSLTACGSGISLDEPIEGPLWRLVQLSAPGAPAVSAESDARRQPQLQFDSATGQVQGSGGCNRLSGSYKRSGSQLHLDQIATTKMACTDGTRMALETHFLQSLRATASYRLPSPGRLNLLNASGQTVASFEAAPR